MLATRSTLNSNILNRAFARTYASKKPSVPAIDYSQYVLRTRDTCFGFNIVKKGEMGFIERFGKLNRPAEPGLHFTIPLVESFGFNIVKKGEMGFIERFGKLNRPVEPGLHFTIPLVESIRRVTLREVAVPIDPQSSVTKDNVYFRVSDPIRACYETYYLLSAIVTHAQSSMRSAVGLIALDTLFHDRSSLNKGILESMQVAAKEWGVDILRYFITEVIPDASVSEAMDAQSIAERKRRETALYSDAQMQQDVTVSEGKKQSVINESLAQQQKIILEAEANKRKVILAAEAEANYILRIGTALRENPETAQYLLAKGYMDNVVKMLPKSTVFLPKDIGDVSRLVATATSIGQQVIQTNIKENNTAMSDSASK